MFELVTLLDNTVASRCIRRRHPAGQSDSEFVLWTLHVFRSLKEGTHSVPELLYKMLGYFTNKPKLALTDQQLLGKFV